MLPVLFAARTGLWNVCGGHVTLGSILAFVIVIIIYQIQRKLLLCIPLYFALALLFWIVGDWVFGPFHLGSVNEFPTY
jgi:ABC-type uncharacterized transport system permease subunit